MFYILFFCHECVVLGVYVHASSPAARASASYGWINSPVKRSELSVWLEVIPRIRADMLTHRPALIGYMLKGDACRDWSCLEMVRISYRHKNRMIQHINWIWTGFHFQPVWHLCKHKYSSLSIFFVETCFRVITSIKITKKVNYFFFFFWIIISWNFDFISLCYFISFICNLFSHNWLYLTIFIISTSYFYIVTSLYNSQWLFSVLNFISPHHPSPLIYLFTY